MLQNGKDWKEISEELSVEAKARPVSVFTVDTRPGTTASLASCVQNSAQSHFVSQISEQEAIQFLNRKKTAEKPSISIEDAIKKISTSSSRIDPERTEAEEAGAGTSKPRIFSKFWGAAADSGAAVWRTQRDQRAASEIIALQRRHEEQAEDTGGFMKKFTKRHKISY